MTRMILIVLLCFISGCASDSPPSTTLERSMPQSEKVPVLDCVSGVPRSEYVFIGVHNWAPRLYLALEQEKGGFLICVYRYSEGSSWDVYLSGESCMMASMLIQSEMNDGDDEKITVWGMMKQDGSLSIRKMFINGHYVIFPE